MTHDQLLKLSQIGSIVRRADGTHPQAEIGVSWLKKIGRLAKKVVRAKILRGAMAGVAVVFPAATPAVVALETANRVMDAVDKGTKKKKKAAKRIIAATYKAAKTGDADAKRALQVFVIAKRAKAMKKALAPSRRAPLLVRAIKAQKAKAAGAVPTRGQLVLPNGRIIHGDWRAA